MKVILFAIMAFVYPMGAFAAIPTELYPSDNKRSLDTAEVPKSFESSARESSDSNNNYIVATSSDGLGMLEDLEPTSAIERPIKAGKKSARRK